MPPRGSIASRVAKVKQAFHGDKLQVLPIRDALGNGCKDYIEKNGWIGMCAQQETIRARHPKRVYYVEGDPATMGWLLGYMAAPHVFLMTTDYRRNVIFDFFDMEELGRRGLGQLIERRVVNRVRKTVSQIAPSMPKAFREEIAGISEGCKAFNGTVVATADLWEINIGADVVLAHMYSRELFRSWDSSGHSLRPYPMCNAFMAPSDDGSRWFGRDFMWPTANVFQKVACLVIYNPVDGKAFVSQTAPGIVGSMAAMNRDGVAVGVNAHLSALSDPQMTGLNSLLLVRDVAAHATSAAQAAKRIQDTQRGLTWFYPVADEKNAFVVEAGKTVDQKSSYLSCMDWRYRWPLRRRLASLPCPRKGAFVRKPGYTYPAWVARLNRKLWKLYSTDALVKVANTFWNGFDASKALVSGNLKDFTKSIHYLLEAFRRKAKYDPRYFDPCGFINLDWKGRNCPGPFYFAPVRKLPKGTIIATNFSISPAMRLTAMNEWIDSIGAPFLNDFQWRYDTLAQLLRDAFCQSPDGLDASSAWNTINFLTPNPSGPFHDYYHEDGVTNWRHIKVKGSVSLFHLGRRWMKSQFGYYGDIPVEVRLLRYV